MKLLLYSLRKGGEALERQTLQQELEYFLVAIIEGIIEGIPVPFVFLLPAHPVGLHEHSAAFEITLTRSCMERDGTLVVCRAFVDSSFDQ